MLAIITSAILALEFVFVIVKGGNSFLLPPVVAPPAVATGNSQLVGMALYQSYLLPFEIASILLLVAIVGAVVLSKKKTATDN